MQALHDVCPGPVVVSPSEQGWQGSTLRAAENEPTGHRLQPLAKPVAVPEPASQAVAIITAEGTAAGRVCKRTRKEE